MTNEYAQALALIPQDGFRDLAEHLGMEVAGPSKSGSWLVRDIDNSVWLFGALRENLTYGRTMVPSAWTELNVSVMNQTFGVKSA